jgi:hypothetical protein
MPSRMVGPRAVQHFHASPMRGMQWRGNAKCGFQSAECGVKTLENSIDGGYKFTP